MKAMICLILDRSGSMAGREADVIGGVNSFIEDQKKLPDPASVAMVRFDTQAIERFRPMQPLAEVKPLEPSDFQPRGGTPLLDAIGQTLVALEEDWKAEQPERAILVIVTDGEENSSHEFTKSKIKEMIESRQSSGKWAVIYLGANVDAFGESASMGILKANSANYVNSSKGVQSMYAAVSSNLSYMRSTGATMACSLGRDIGEDEQPDFNQAFTSISTPTTTPNWTPPAPVQSGSWRPPV